MKQYFIFLMIVVYVSFSAGELCAKEKVSEQEIRQIICEIDNGNYQGAAANLGKILQKDPQNVYALRLLPGVLTGQIKKGDRSPENIATIRKAIAAFEQSLQKLEPSAKEKESVNSFIIDLYGRIGEKEKEAYLVKRAETPSLSAEERADAFTRLAAAFNACANRISDQPAVKKIVRKAGKEVFVFTKPKRAEDFERLKECTAKGLELVDKAVELEKQSGTENELVWSYKASLLVQKTRIAEMEDDAAEKERLKTETEAAIKRFREISDKNRNAKDAPIDERLPAAVPAQVLTELTTYKIETKLDDLVRAIYVPTDYLELVAPVPVGQGRQSRAKVNSKAKTIWKIFSPNDEFTAAMPGNAAVNGTATGEIYEADGSGISFFIISQPRSAAQTAEFDAAVLNTLAWTMAQAIGNLSMKDEWGNTFEVNFVRNEKISGQSAKIYAYSLGSCKSKTDGILIMLAGKTNNYAISIKGANEQDARTQRFLKSLKIKG